MGTLPTHLGALSSLTWLELQQNALSGSLPTELASLQRLNTLYLFENLVSGTLPPSFGNLTNLYTFAVGANLISGTIPSTYGSLKRLLTLGLRANKLYGTLPSELGSLTALTLFNIDTLPCIYGPLVSVGSLGTSYHVPGDGTSLGNWTVPASCNITLPPAPPPPPSPPTLSPPPPSPPSQPLTGDTAVYFVSPLPLSNLTRGETYGLSTTWKGRQYGTQPDSCTSTHMVELLDASGARVLIFSPYTPPLWYNDGLFGCYFSQLELMWTVPASLAPGLYTLKDTRVITGCPQSPFWCTYVNGEGAIYPPASTHVATVSVQIVEAQPSPPPRPVGLFAFPPPPPSNATAGFQGLFPPGAQAAAVVLPLYEGWEMMWMQRGPWAPGSGGNYSYIWADAGAGVTAERASYRFYKEVYLGAPLNAGVWFYADDNATLFINGVQVGVKSRVTLPTWLSAGIPLVSGRNVFEVRASNIVDGGPAALRLYAYDLSSNTFLFGTDASWYYLREDNGELPPSPPGPPPPSPSPPVATADTAAMLAINASW